MAKRPNLLPCLFPPAVEPNTHPFWPTSPPANKKTHRFSLVGLRVVVQILLAQVSALDALLLPTHTPLSGASSARRPAMMLVLLLIVCRRAAFSEPVDGMTRGLKVSTARRPLVLCETGKTSRPASISVRRRRPV